MKTKTINHIKSEVFTGSIILKGINGIIESIGGLILLFTNSQVISRYLKLIFNHELENDPSDKVVNFLINYFQNISQHTQVFAATYILLHGIMNLFLFSMVWKKKIHAYPIVVVIMSLLVIYQIIRFSHTHSVILFVITLVDMLIIYLIADEYTRKK